jgi:hypothetical protein
MHFWFFANANKSGPVPLPQSNNLKVALTSVLIGSINVASYPGANPQTLSLRTGLRGDPVGPARVRRVHVMRFGENSENENEPAAT